jgi:hypothetical protein
MGIEMKKLTIALLPPGATYTTPVADAFRVGGARCRSASGVFNISKSL